VPMRILLALLILALLGAGLAPRARAQSGPVLVTETRLAGSNDVKFPHVDTQDRTVYVSGNAERAFARLWTKADTAATFGGPATLGAAEGQPDQSSTAVFTAPDGTVHFAWSNAETRRVLLRSKAPGQADFGPERLVVGSSPLPVEVEVAANEDGVFVFWREPDQPIKYRRSLDGVSWTNQPIQSLGSAIAEPRIEVSAAANRRLAVSSTRGLDDRLQGFVGIWNGSGFALERIPTVTDRDFADPTVTYLPDGSLAAALRSTADVDGFGAGVYVTDRAPNGTWSGVGRLSRGSTIYAGIDADDQGNLHLFWINQASGGNDLWYTARRAGTAYGGSPLIVDTGDLPIFNIRAAASLADRSYGHAVAERFAGGTPFIQYFLFGLPVNLVSAQGILIEGGQERTNKAAVEVSFAGPSGNPTEVRWRWNAPPSDAANDSAGFRPFTNPISVPGPALANPALCSTATLFTQLRAGAALQLTPNSDAIVFDRAVQSSYGLSAPYAGFDPGYTNVPTATVSVDNSLECSGLLSAAISGAVPGGTLPLAGVDQPALRVNVALAGGPGAKELAFSASDRVGNSTSAPISRTIVYDPTPPSFTDAGDTIAPAPQPNGTSIVEIALANALAGDDLNLYGIVVTPAVTPTGGGAPVTGTPIVVPFTQMNQFSRDASSGRIGLRASINLARSLPAAALVPGSYALVIQFVDAAGNRSAASTTRTVPIERVTFPTFLPIGRR
jgi:hypothetical protein